MNAELWARAAAALMQAGLADDLAADLEKDASMYLSAGAVAAMNSDGHELKRLYHFSGMSEASMAVAEAIRNAKSERLERLASVSENEIKAFLAGSGMAGDMAVSL